MGVVARASAIGPLSQHVVTQDDLIRRYQQWIQLHFAKPMDVAAICNELEISRRQLERQCQHEHRQTPAKLLLNKRLEHADKLLNSDSSMNAIATKCGFLSSSHFSRVYRRERGIAPSQSVKTRQYKRLHNCVAQTFTGPIVKNTNVCIRTLAWPTHS